jgi:hypothetical protein
VTDEREVACARRERDHGGVGAIANEAAVQRPTIPRKRRAQPCL